MRSRRRSARGAAPSPRRRAAGLREQTDERQQSSAPASVSGRILNGADESRRVDAQQAELLHADAQARQQLGVAGVAAGTACRSGSQGQAHRKSSAGRGGSDSSAGSNVGRALAQNDAGRPGRRGRVLAQLDLGQRIRPKQRNRRGAHCTAASRPALRKRIAQRNRMKANGNTSFDAECAKARRSLSKNVKGPTSSCLSTLRPPRGSPAGHPCDHAALTELAKCTTIKPLS